MKRYRIIEIGVAVVLGVFLYVATSTAAQLANPVTLMLQRVGTSSFASAPTATDFTTQPDEIDAATNGDADSGAGGDDNFGGVNRTLPGAKTGKGNPVKAGARPKSNPQLGTHFEGLNLFNQRFANGGNQFSVEPPDQGLCVGNGFVLETVNDVLRVYRTDGTPATGVVDLNTFYGYPAAINRSAVPTTFGPSITDPSCIYDQVIGRFVHVVLTLDRANPTTQTLSGRNHLDIAVSDTGDPTGTWTIFTLPVQNNGTEGTPDHHCTKGFCLGDYPHIGADANGIYLTTNEFAVFGAGFFGAQVYAIGHNLLTEGVGKVVLFNTLGAGPDGAGFTVWPAQNPGNQFDTSDGGTEYFLSSRAVFSDDGTSTSILVWKITNTSSLNSTTPSPAGFLAAIDVDQYAVPPRATQKSGSFPLSQCLADLTVYNFLQGTGTCGAVVAGRGNNHNNTTFGPPPTPPHALNANDSRMQQVSYANGKLWGSLDTTVNVGGQDRAGIAYYVINPNAVKLVLQGQAGMASTDLTYPALAVTESGRGVIAFTFTGDNDYPSAAFAGLDAKVGMGDIQVAASGAGPWDGFTSYVQFGAGRPRWGDYGAAAVDGSTIWIASEYVAQTCTYATYLTGDHTCGGTRAPLGNWSTHISHITP
jgi:hypothetical protein